MTGVLIADCLWIRWAKFSRNYANVSLLLPLVIGPSTAPQPTGICWRLSPFDSHCGLKGSFLMSRSNPRPTHGIQSSSSRETLGEPQQQLMDVQVENNQLGNDNKNTFCCGFWYYALLILFLLWATSPAQHWCRGLFLLCSWKEINTGFASKQQLSAFIPRMNSIPNPSIEKNHQDQHQLSSCSRPTMLQRPVNRSYSTHSVVFAGYFWSIKEPSSSGNDKQITHDEGAFAISVRLGKLMSLVGYGQ